MLTFDTWIIYHVTKPDNKIEIKATIIKCNVILTFNISIKGFRNLIMSSDCHIQRLN